MKYYLLIEDDDIDIMIVKSMINLIHPFIKPIIVYNGQEALSFLDQYLKEATNQKPEFILLDLNMPTMNGFEFLKTYYDKFYPDFPEIPIIIGNKFLFGKITE